MKDEAQRFAVTCQRTFIIYATSVEEAALRAKALLPDMTVVSTEVLPTLAAELKTPIVDNAPARETRK
jgi:hypothetical protein